jgi:hypothetical protein
LQQLFLLYSFGVLPSSRVRLWPWTYGTVCILQLVTLPVPVKWLLVPTASFMSRRPALLFRKWAVLAWRTAQAQEVRVYRISDALSNTCARQPLCSCSSCQQWTSNVRGLPLLYSSANFGVWFRVSAVFMQTLKKKSVVSAPRDRRLLRRVCSDIRDQFYGSQIPQRCAFLWLSCILCLSVFTHPFVFSELTSSSVYVRFEVSTAVRMNTLLFSVLAPFRRVVYKAPTQGRTSSSVSLIFDKCQQRLRITSPNPQFPTRSRSLPTAVFSRPRTTNKAIALLIIVASDTLSSPSNGYWGS